MTTLVLLPGLAGTGELFTPFVAALGPAVETRIVRYPVDAALGYESLTEIARAALPADRPFILLGESFSGPIAIRLAAAGGNRLRGLILCCSFARNPRPGLGGLRAALPLLPFLPRPVGLLSPLLMGRHATEDLRRDLRHALQQVSTVALAARLRAVLAVDVAAELQQVRVPTLYLQATEDRLVPAAVLRNIRQIRPDIEIAALAAPHFLLQTEPGEAARAVLEFTGRAMASG